MKKKNSAYSDVNEDRGSRMPGCSSVRLFVKRVLKGDIQWEWQDFQGLRRFAIIFIYYLLKRF